MAQYRQYLEGVFRQGVSRCHPSNALAEHLNIETIKGQTFVIGAGKAAVEMASVVYDLLGDKVSGAVVTRYGQGEHVQTGKIRKLYASHPIPDDNSLFATHEIIEIAKNAKEGDRVICLISGGGSALLTYPKDGVSLEVLQDITRCLVSSGAPIEDINCVRRHLSQVKGGRLASAARPAYVITYSISDVVGDDPANIASGPTVKTEHDAKRAIFILEQAGYTITEQIKSVILDNGVIGSDSDEYHIIAKGSDALSTVSRSLKGDGWTVFDLGTNLTGDASKTGSLHAQDISTYLNKKGKYAFVSGGELTVDVKNDNGAGGPNLEYLASLLFSLPRNSNFEALAGDSDGIDGSRNNAGGYINGATLDKCDKLSLSVAHSLAENNSYDLFSKLDQLLVTGPTGTNVNDIRIILVSND